MLLRTSLKPATPGWIVAFRHGSVQTVRAMPMLLGRLEYILRRSLFQRPAAHSWATKCGRGAGQRSA